MSSLGWLLIVGAVIPAGGLRSQEAPGGGPEAVLAALEQSIAAGREVDLSGVLELGRERMHPALVARAAAARDEIGRVAVLRALGAVGTARDLDLAVQASGSGSAGPAERELERTLREILARDAEAARGASQLALHASLDRAPAILRALAGCGSSAQVELIEILGHTSELDLVVLSSLVGNLRSEGPGTDAASVARALRPYLSSQDVQLARESAAAIGELGDDDALPELIRLLEAGNPAVADAAHRALASITGLAWGPDVSRWRRWLHAEQSWFGQRAPSLLADLGDTPAWRALTALGELGGHRYRRRELVAGTQRALEHPVPEVRAAACRALARLGWRGAAHALVDVLACEEPCVVKAAGSALRELTGLAFGDDDLQAWRAALL